MTLRVGLPGVMCGLLCGCGNLPEPYAPPAQRPFFAAPPETARIINMADADAESHFIQDIDTALQGNAWRWTGKRPSIHVHINATDTNATHRLVYAIDFVIAGATFQQTGPVTLSFLVNDHLLDRVRYTSPGPQRLEKPVPAEWLQADRDATVTAEIDKVWTPPQAGGAPLGFILVALGLEERGAEPK